MKLISVTDTRDKVVVPGMFRDRLVGIPGTGIEGECEICGRKHEIHARIEDDHGRMMTVGIGCAKRLDGMKAQIRALEIAEELAALTPPAPYTVQAMPGCDYMGRREFEIRIDGQYSRIADADEKGAMKYATRYLRDKATKAAWGVYLKDLYRLRNLLRKWAVVE